MIRWISFFALAAGMVAYAFWIYLRVELRVRHATRLAVVRALALVAILALLFDLRLPEAGSGGAEDRWVLLDASLSMGATLPDGAPVWDGAVARARALEADGWSVVTFGAGVDRADTLAEAEPLAESSRLASALERAAESGVRSVRVLSDLRLEDRVAVGAALAELPLDVEFEGFGEGVVNAGISGFFVPDLVNQEGSVVAEVEVHATVDDSLVIEVLEEDRAVARETVPAPDAGLRARVHLDLPTPTGTGRVRYTASVSLEGDGFSSDDVAVRYAAVGSQGEALVLLSLRPDWEPRYLLPVLGEVTGLPTVGFMRVGPDRFAPMGRAVDRGEPIDSAAVGRALSDAAVLVLHGLDADADAWARTWAERPGRKILLPDDAGGARLAGLVTGEARDGEWYASPDVPASPIAGSLAGLALQDLPPLSGVLLPTDPAGVRGPLLVQLRGTGSPEAALHLDDRDDGRTVVILARDLWRWAAREDGREAYRRLWSGVAGWLLGDQTVSPAEMRPTEWVVARGEPVTWNVPTDSASVRLVVNTAGTDGAAGTEPAVVDTVVAGGEALSTGRLPPGAYEYRVEGGTGDTIAVGRFDVASATAEMAPAALDPTAVESAAEAARVSVSRPGLPLRTRPWPYLLVIGLLCGEWIGRRRSGLR